MPYQTDERLKGYLDTNQLHREQICRSILAIDKRFSEVHPRHPRGGADGGRDIEAIYKDSLLTYGAIGFVNQANDSKEQKRTIKKKFEDDLNSALNAEVKPSCFVFFTNINLSISEKDSLINKTKGHNIVHCEIFDRERMRISLDSPDGLSSRFQYLNISLSDSEQASFFARWGDDIQSVIATGFQRIEDTLSRILFLQEYNNTMSHFTLSFELDNEYSAEEIGHLRVFCMMHLKEPKLNIVSMFFGTSDDANRIRQDLEKEHKQGVKYGLSGGTWNSYLSTDKDEESEEKYTCTTSFSSIGIDPVSHIQISYSQDRFIRMTPGLALRDMEEAIFLPIVNESFASKIEKIHIYSNGYKLRKIDKNEFAVDSSEFSPDWIPIEFTTNELNDKWVRIRPNNASVFDISFFKETPERIFNPTRITSN